jgi:hypothetical protein
MAAKTTIHVSLSLIHRGMLSSSAVGLALAAFPAKILDCSGFVPSGGGYA